MSNSIWWDMRSLLDEMRRVTIPKHLVEEFNLGGRCVVTFAKEDAIVMRKASKTKDKLAA